MNPLLKALACGLHVFLALTCLPTNYLGLGVNAGLAVVWALMFFAPVVPSTEPL